MNNQKIKESIIKPFVKDINPDLSEEEVEERSEVFVLMLKDFLMKNIFNK